MGPLQAYLEENRFLYDKIPLSHDHGLLGIQAILPPLISFIRRYNHQQDLTLFNCITEAQLDMGMESINQYTDIPTLDHKLLRQPRCDMRTLYTWLNLFSQILNYNHKYQEEHHKHFNHLWYFLPHFCIQKPINIGGYEPGHILSDNMWLLLNNVVSNTLYNKNSYASDTRLTEHFVVIAKYFENDIWEDTNICIDSAFYYLQKIGIICLMTRVFDIPNIEVSFKNELYDHLIRIIPSM